MTLKELREIKGKLAAEIKAQADVLTADGHVETPEQRGAFDKVNADYDRNEQRIKDAERAAAVAGEIQNRNDEQREQRAGRENATGNTGGETPEQRERDLDLAFRGWLAYQGGQPVKPEWREAADAVGMQFHVKEINTELRRDGDYLPAAKTEQEIRKIATARENRAQSSVVGALGGYLTAPPTMANALEVAMLYYGGIMSVAEVLRTDTGNEFQWPGYNDTGNSGRQIGESAAVTVTDFVPSKDTWGAYKFTSDEVKVPYELLEDSAFDIPTIVGAMLGERIGRILNTKGTTGTGANTIQGIVTAASTGVTSATATAIKYDEIIDLIYSVDLAYRSGAAFMCNDGIVKHLRKLKDGNGNYLWQKSTQGGQPDTLDVYPLYINNDMQATVATGTKTMIFGQLSKYKMRLVRGVRSYRLVERHRENDQDAFVSFIRADGGLLNSGGNPVQCLLQS